MRVGVGGIDAVLLVVAADESVMPQTREHFDICRLLDIRSGVIALTRCDLADETMQAVAESDVQELVAGTPLASAPIIRVSARTGQGLDALAQALVRCADSRRERQIDVPARLPIDRVFTVKGFGTVATGTLWSGSLLPDSELTLWPAGKAVRVRGLQVHGVPADRAGAGQRVAVNLAGVALDQVERGHVLLGEGVALSSRRLAVDVELLPGAPAQKHGTRLHVHLGTSVVLGRLILPARESVGGVRALPPGAAGEALLRLESPLPARRGDRLVLRSYSPVTTVGGACVTDPLPPPRLLQASGVRTADPAALILSRVSERGAFGCHESELPARCGLPVTTTRQAVRALGARGDVVSLGEYWVAGTVLPEMRAMLLGLIDAAHAVDPLQGGIPRASLRMAGGRRWRPELVDLVLSRLIQEGVVTGDDRIARAAQAPAGRDPMEERLFAAIDAAGLQGLSVQELDAALPGLDRKGTATLLARLVKARDVERVADLCIVASRLKGLTDELRRLAGTGEVPARIEVGWFKERYGLTRRSAIPLLEWLDRTRVTRREGESRVLIGT